MPNDESSIRVAVHVKPRAEACVILKLDPEMAEQVWLSMVHRKKLLVTQQKALSGMRLEKPAKEVGRLIERLESGEGTGLIRDLCPQGDLEAELEAQTATG